MEENTIDRISKVSCMYFSSTFYEVYAEL